METKSQAIKRTKTQIAFYAEQVEFWTNAIANGLPNYHPSELIQNLKTCAWRLDACKQNLERIN